MEVGEGQWEGAREQFPGGRCGGAIVVCFTEPRKLYTIVLGFSGQKTKRKGDASYNGFNFTSIKAMVKRSRHMRQNVAV